MDLCRRPVNGHHCQLATSVVVLLCFYDCGIKFIGFREGYSLVDEQRL
jgi:hypothetical protein